MFESLTTKLDGIFKKLRGHGKLTEENIQEALKEVRIALLEADVNFKVVKDFIQSVQERAIGQEVMASLTPAQQLIKIVKEEMTSLMGSERRGDSPFGKSSCADHAGRPSRLRKNDDRSKIGEVFQGEKETSLPHSGRRLPACGH